MSAIIDIEVSRYAPSGTRYRIWHDGQELLSSAREPMCEAARALSLMGVTGRLQMRRLGREQIDAEGLIAILATRTVSEGQATPPRFAAWSPHSMSDGEQE